MRELIDKVQELVVFELNRANTIHPPKFNSMHEAYAVILEEFEEAKDDLESAEWTLREIWFETKANRCKDDIDVDIEELERRATLGAAEMIQVAAMCRKARL